MSSRSARTVLLWVLLALSVVSLLISRAVADEPRIDYIYYEKSQNWVTIHYYMAANKVYHLEATYNLQTGPWTNLYTFGPLDFDGFHIAYADYVTSTQRFYRLRVTP